MQAGMPFKLTSHFNPGSIMSQQMMSTVAGLTGKDGPSGDSLQVRAFVWQSLKAAFGAGNTKGSGAMVWPPLGLNDPYDLKTSLASPTERAALAAYQEERLILAKAAATAAGK